MYRQVFAWLLLTLIIFQPGGSGAADVRVEKLAIHTADGIVGIEAEIAHTPELRARGLMFRETLAADRGMLFLYDMPQKVTMWMKNTFIALDMLFIREDGVIVKITEHTVPHSLDTISSGVPVVQVLELRAGAVQQLKIRKGDRVAIR